jgi:ribosomal protein S27E
MAAYPPRHGDLPRLELMADAARALEQNGPTAEVHFKYTCAGCGERMTLSEPNMLRESGECAACGHVTVIERGGFLIISRDVARALDFAKTVDES